MEAEGQTCSVFQSDLPPLAALLENVPVPEP